MQFGPAAFHPYKNRCLCAGMRSIRSTCMPRATWLLRIVRLTREAYATSPLINNIPSIREVLMGSFVRLIQEIWNSMSIGTSGAVLCGEWYQINRIYCFATLPRKSFKSSTNSSTSKNGILVTAINLWRMLRTGGRICYWLRLFMIGNWVFGRDRSSDDCYVIKNIIMINVLKAATGMRCFYTWDTCCIIYRSLFLLTTSVSTILSFMRFLALFNVVIQSIV